MYARILVAMALCGALLASAQNTNAPPNARLLSLRECFDLALSRNLDLQIQHLSGDIARDSLTAAYGTYVPNLSFAAGHEHDEQPGDFDWKKENPYLPYELNQDTAGPALSGRLPFGLSYGFHAEAGENKVRTDFNSNTNIAPDFYNGIRQTNNYFANAGVVARQHLLKDFWIDQDRVTLLVRRRDLKISQQALRFQIMRTVLATELDYYDLTAAREKIRVAEKAVELKRQFLAETRRRVEVGDLPPLDAGQAESQLQTALTALTAARDEFLDLQNALKSLLTDNFKEWADIDLQPADALSASQTEVNRSESFQSALRNRPDLVEARLAVEKSDVVVKFRLNQLFPSLDFIGKYGGLGVEPTASGAMSDTVNFRNHTYFYGMVVTFPLSNVGERGDYRASKAAKQIAELQLKKAEQAILVEVADWVHRVQSRFSQVGSTRQARAYAEAALAAEQKKLQNGLTTAFVVLQMQEALTAARTAEVQALSDYNKALAQLAFAEGSILEKHHLTLEVK